MTSSERAVLIRLARRAEAKQALTIRNGVMAAMIDDPDHQYSLTLAATESDQRARIARYHSRRRRASNRSR